MALSKEEEIELEILEAIESGKLTPEEGDELLQLELGELGGNKVIKEGHPDISFKTRFLYKNLGVNDDEAFNYLQKENPNLQFKKDSEGDVLVKGGTGGNQWMYLDPPGFDVQDITDVAYDIPAGMLEGAASALGGIGGGIIGTAVTPGIGTGVGAIGGAMTAGGLAGRYLEKGRQALGKWSGVSQTEDPQAVDVATTFGAISPLLLGTGAGAKQVAKYAGRKTLADATKRGLLEEAQRAPLARIKSALPKLGEATSGVPQEAIRYASKNIPEIKAAQEIAKSEGIDLAGADVVRDTRKRIQEALDRKDVIVKSEFSAALENISKDPKSNVNVKEAFEPMQKLYKEYEDEYLKELKILESQVGKEKAAKEIKDRASYKEFQDVKKAFKEIRPLNQEISPKDAYNLQKKVNKFSEIKKSFDASTTKTGAAGPIINTTRQVADKIGENIDNIEGAGSEFAKAKKEYGNLINLKDKVKKNFGDFSREGSKDADQALQKTESTLLRVMGSGNQSQKQNIKNLSKELGIDIEEDAARQTALKFYTDPQIMPISSGGTTSTSRSNIAEGTLGEAGFLTGVGATGNFQGGLMGRLAGRTLGAVGAGPWSQMQMMKANKAATAIPEFLQRVGPANIGTPINTGINVWQNLEQNER